MRFQAFQAFFRFAQQQDSQAFSKPLNVHFVDETVTHKPPNMPSFRLHIFSQIVQNQRKSSPDCNNFHFLFLYLQHRTFAHLRV